MSIEKELKKGFLITFVSKYSNFIFELIISIVLARLLSPKEFGIVAVIFVFTTFFNLLGEIGVGAAIIQNKNLNNKHIQSIFNYTALMAVVSGVGFSLISYIIADFYENDEYIKIGHLLSFVVFFYILNVVPQALIRKEKKFLKLEGSIFVINVVSGLLAIYLALNGSSFYALVYREIVKSILLFIVNFHNSKFRIGYNFNIDGIILIFNYSFFQFLFNVINYFSRNLDNILIAKFLGATSLGFYDKAYRLMLYPVQTLTFVITPVLHPVLAKYENEPEVIYLHYKKILEILAFLGIPFSVFLFYSSEEVISGMYGGQWSASVPVFKILSLSVWIQMTLSSTGSIFQALGKTKLLFISGLISAFFTILGILFGIMQNDLEMVGYGILFAFCLNFIQGFYLLFVLGFKKTFFHFFIFFKLGAISGLILLGELILFEFLNCQNIYLSLFLKLILLIISLVFGAFLVKKEYFRMIIKKIKY